MLCLNYCGVWGFLKENVEIFVYTSIQHFAMIFHVEIYPQITSKRVKKLYGKETNPICLIQKQILYWTRN